MILNTYIESLKKAEPLNEEQLIAVQHLTPFIKSKKIPKYGFLYEEGDRLDITFMVEKGLFRLFTEGENSNEKILQFLKEYDFYDDCKSYFEYCPISYNIQALEDTVISYIHMTDFEKLAMQYPALNSIGRNINYESMADHKDHLEALMSKNPEDRYRYIQLNKPYLIQRVTVTHLAQYLGMSRESLSRIRGKKIPL